MSYICKDATVRISNGKEGTVIGVNKPLQVATVQIGNNLYTDSIKNMKVVSYRDYGWSDYCKYHG